MVKMKPQSSKIPPVGDEAYVYDKNGNMIEDKYKKIKITYNYLNLPLQITYKENNFIHFVYSATGEKLQKIITVEGKVQSKTDYINGIEYKNDMLQRIAHTEGSLSRQDDDKFLQEYVLRDHLGNTRVTFTDADNDGNINEKDIKQINNYYCFGLNMEGNWNGAAGSNKYQYNGKSWEDDFGLGWNDYGARFYDPAIDRWIVIDPESESGEQRNVNPYHYVYDNPIKNTDPDGREPEGCCGGIGTRIVGALQVLGGASEMVAGAALILTPEPTLLTKVGGVAVAVHGADNVSTGFTKLFTGKDQQTLTSQGLQATGLSKSNAETADAVIGIVGTGTAGAIVNKTTAVAAQELTKSELKAVSSYKGQITAHQEKLAAYVKDPSKFDNKGQLAKAPTEEIKQKIIAGRIKHLESEIKTFKDNIQKIYDNKKQ